MLESKRSEGIAQPTPDTADVAKANPKVDVKQVREAQTLVEKLRKEGLSRPEYGIASPYERRRRQARRMK